MLGTRNVTTLTANIPVDPDTGRYYGVVPGIPGAYTQAKTLEELRQNLKEVLELCFAEAPEILAELPEFIGSLQIEISSQLTDLK